ncbi:MAG: MFS transporter [Chloroflexi bacterium]|nr:MAG: MFS transporter [Chloroflexota bacterium]
MARLFLNTGLRMVYPFAPELSRGLGVPLASIYRLITLRNLTGFLSPLFGPLSEKYGRKPVILGSLAVFSLGCFLIVLWPAYWPLGATLAIISITKVIFDPAMQAYLGDTVSYDRRGRALAITELAWAGAILAGAPLVSLAIQRQGWTAPFLWMGLLVTGATLWLWRILPHSGQGLGQAGNWQEIWRVVQTYPVIWAAALYIFLVMTANEILFIVYGNWMESSFSLSLTSLGLATAVLGGAEITGELFAGWSVDRFGKRPVILITGLLNALLYALIPFTSNTLTAALISLFAVFLTFETTVVGGVPLLTEIVPQARGVVMSVALAAGALGRTVGSLGGPAIWENAGMIGNGLVAAFIMAIALIVLATQIREADSAAREFQLDPLELE